MWSTGLGVSLPQNSTRITQIASTKNGKPQIFGAQIVGAASVDTRIDVMAIVMRAGMNVRELAELELSYAPPFNSAKDPQNMAGMIAQNVLDGVTRLPHADSLPQQAFFLDVRGPGECASGVIPGSTNIPLDQLRDRMGELPSGIPIVAVCQVGLRAYLAERILRQNGFTVLSLSGGYRPGSDAAYTRRRSGWMRDIFPFSICKMGVIGCIIGS